MPYRLALVVCLVGLFFILPPHFVAAQPTKKVSASTTAAKKSPVPKRAADYYAKSAESYQLSRYTEAVEWLQKALHRYPAYTEAYKRLATYAREQKDFPLAKSTYQQLLKYDTTTFTNFMVHYYLADMAYKQQQYAEAIQLSEKALPLIGRLKGVTDTPDKLRRLYGNAKFAQDALQHPVAFQPVALDSTINSSHHEYLPAITADKQQLFFTRNFDGDINRNEDIYYSTWQDSTWRIGVSLGNGINTAGDEGALCISPDGKRLFFAARDRVGGLGDFDIYYCVRSGEGSRGRSTLAHRLTPRAGNRSRLFRPMGWNFTLPAAARVEMATLTFG